MMITRIFIVAIVLLLIPGAFAGNQNAPRSDEREETDTAGQTMPWWNCWSQDERRPSVVSFSSWWNNLTNSAADGTATPRESSNSNNGQLSGTDLVGSLLQSGSGHRQGASQTGSNRAGSSHPELSPIRSTQTGLFAGVDGFENRQRTSPHVIVAMFEAELKYLQGIPKSTLTAAQRQRLEWLKRWKQIRLSMKGRKAGQIKGMWHPRVFDNASAQRNRRRSGNSNRFINFDNNARGNGSANGNININGSGNDTVGGGTNDVHVNNGSNSNANGNSQVGTVNGNSAQEPGSNVNLDSRTGSLADIQRGYDEVVGRHQQITDNADVTANGNLPVHGDNFTNEPFGGTTNGTTFDVATMPGDQISQQSLPGGMAGNPAQQAELGFTWAAAPNEHLSHYGPPDGSEGQVFQYFPPYNVDVGSQFASQANAGSAYVGVNQTTQAQVTDTGYQMNLLTMGSKFVDQVTSPGRWTHGASASAQAMQQGAAEAAGGVAQSTLENVINQVGKGLINVANEGASQPCDVHAPIRTISQSAWMVQQMFKSVYFPIALLLLLPGALLTQTKGLIKFTAMAEGDDDAFGPFAGILRAIIAIVLIPATQIMISYSIDVGNSMTYELQQFLNQSEIVQWAQAQNGQAGQSSVPDMEQQTTMEQTQNRIFNFINMALGFGITVLIAFQTVMICYLYLLGPIAAAFFAWPSGQRLFKPVFSNWLNSVTNLALWRFWWCLIVLCMCTRISWLKEMGQYDPNSPWESIMYTAFLVLLMYVPFAAFEFRPGDLVERMLQKAGQGGAGGGGTGAGNGGGGGTGGPPPANPGETPADTGPQMRTEPFAPTGSGDEMVA